MTTPAHLRAVEPMADLETEILRLELEGHRCFARATELRLELKDPARKPSAAPPDSKLLTYEEAASDLGMSPDFVRGLCRDGRLPVVKLGARRRIRRSDLEELKERRVFRRQ